MLSRVVPGWSKAMTRSSPMMALTSVDLPTFGRPTIAIFGRAAIGRPGCASLDRELLQHQIHQLVHAVSVRGGDRQRLPRPSSWNSAAAVSRDNPSLLFTTRYSGRPALRSTVRDVAVLGGDAGTAINQQQHGIGFVHRLQRLPRHRVKDALLCRRLQPAGVNHQVGLRAQAPMAVVPIAREAWNVGHQRIAAAGEAVEQRRLAHVRPADQCDGGFHRGRAGEGRADEGDPARRSGDC